MQNLDDLNIYDTIDPQQARLRHWQLPDEIEQAYAAVAKVNVSQLTDMAHVQNVLVVGMGGGGIGADMIANYVQPKLNIPIQVVHHYSLPRFANAHSLVIACSYSGNTEEVVSFATSAHHAKCQIIAICKGGALAKLCAEHGYPRLHIAHEDPAGEVIGWMMCGLLGILSKLGLIEDAANDIAECVAVLRQTNNAIGIESPARRNPAKRLAGQFMDRLPIIYGSGMTTAVARRWKTMLNTYAKMQAFTEELPDMNHNAIESYEHVQDIWRRSIVLQLRSQNDPPRVAQRFELTTQFLLEAGINQDSVHAKGQSDLAQLMSLVLFGDWVAYYTAVLSGINPITEERIHRFKGLMSDM
jgi:glucose/mannose-6-phosphate isomerase